MKAKTTPDNTLFIVNSHFVGNPPSCPVLGDLGVTRCDLLGLSDDKSLPLFPAVSWIPGDTCYPPDELHSRCVIRVSDGNLSLLRLFLCIPAPFY